MTSQRHIASLFYWQDLFYRFCSV